MSWYYPDNRIMQIRENYLRIYRLLIRSKNGKGSIIKIWNIGISNYIGKQ